MLRSVRVKNKAAPYILAAWLASSQAVPAALSQPSPPTRVQARDKRKEEAEEERGSRPPGKEEKKGSRPPGKEEKKGSRPQGKEEKGSRPRKEEKDGEEKKGEEKDGEEMKGKEKDGEEKKEQEKKGRRPTPTGRRYVPVVQASYWYFGFLPVEGRSSAADIGTRIQFLRLQAQFGHMFRRTKTLVAGAVGYDLALVTHDDVRGGTTLSPLHHINVRLVVGQRVHRKWSVTVFGRPGIASDMAGVSGRDFRVSAGAVARFGYRPRLSFLFGVLYNNGVFGHIALPVLAVQYRWRRLRVDFHFPQHFQVWYLPFRMLEVGFTAQFVSGLYAIHDRERQLSIQDELSALFVHGGGAARFYLHRGWYVMVEGGYLVRQLRMFFEGHKTHETLDFKGWYAGISSGYML